MGYISKKNALKKIHQGYKALMITKSIEELLPLKKDIDGKIITYNGSKTNIEFGLEILNIIESKENEKA